MNAAPKPGPPQLPPRRSTPNNEIAPLLGGPADGLRLTRRRGHNWPRFLAADGERIHGRRGESLLRAADSDAGAYLFVTLPVAPSMQDRAPVSPGYVFSGECVERRTVWPVVAAALGGTHVGRVLTRGSNDPADVLDALLNHVDDLIRLRVRRDDAAEAATDPEPVMAPAPNPATVDHTPARAAILGLLTGIDDNPNNESNSDDDMTGALDAILDDIAAEQPFPVALGAIEIAAYLMKQLRQWTGQSQKEILTEMAAELTRRTLDRTEGA